MLETFLALIPLLQQGLPKAYEAAVNVLDKIKGGKDPTTGEWMTIHAAYIEDSGYNADIDAAKARAAKAAGTTSTATPAPAK